jgi:arylsulfatase A-like enzyme
MARGAAPARDVALVASALRGLALGLVGVGLLALLLACGPAGAQGRPPPRPNVVLVVTDDLGRAELGAYGQQTLRTPAIDGLFARGTRFLQAYATAPVCAPSRCSILTGLHTGHCAVTENGEPNMPLASRDPTIAELLAAAGYRGAMVGKWALGGELDEGTPWNTQSAPWRVGFGDVLAVLDQELAQDYYPEWMWRASGGEGEVVPFPTNGDGARGTYAPDVFGEHALSLLRTLPEPFFLYVAMTLPHRELVAPPGAVLDPALAIEDATYAAMITRMDEDVGALLEALRARGVEERTVVVFTSDHGPNQIDGHSAATFGSTGGLRGRKRDLYEGGIRVPLVVAGAGLEARDAEEPVSLADLLPTLTALAGAPTPPGLDGRSLLPSMTGVEVEGHPHLYFACNERHGGAEPATREAVRDGRWKWVRSLDGREELFDLERDPGEAHDLSAEEPEVTARLRARARLEATPRPRPVPPTLRVSIADVARGEVGAGSSMGEPGPAPGPDSPTPVLSLDAGDVEDDGRTWPQRVELPALVASLVDAEVVRGEPPFVRLSRARGGHVVVPAHPALAVGGWSFTMHARFRLTSLASGPERDERQWLLFAKPTGLHDVHASFGVLAQAGDLGCSREAPAECTGREVALLFGDPRLDPARPTVLVGELSIEDDRVHDLVVRVDRTRGVVELVLDDRTEVVPFLVTEGIVAEAPILLGAHHDGRGRFAQGLDGELHFLRLAEGLATDDELARFDALSEARELRLELGEVELGALAAADLSVESLRWPGAHWVEASVELDSGAPAHLEPTLSRGLLFAGDRQRVRVALDTSRAGAVEADLVVRASRGRTGALVRGAPVRVHVSARVTTPRPATSGGSLALLRGLGAGLVLVTLVISAFALAGRRGSRHRSSTVRP